MTDLGLTRLAWKAAQYDMTRMGTMQNKRNTAGVLALGGLGVVFCLCLLGACARYGSAPTGGPVDLAPPVLLSALPPEGDTGVALNGPTEILLNFDEYVVLNATDKIVVSPLLSKVSYMGHLKQVRVTIEDTLLPGKTYSINFNDAIGDLHESTPLSGYTYFFSTGSKVDSGRIDGIVRDAFDLKPVPSASVMFYSQKPEGYPVTALPDYVAVTDTGGYFQCRYMAKGCYYILVSNEESRDYLVDPTQEKLAYSSDCWPTQAYRPPVLFRKKAGVKESDSLVRRANDSLIALERNLNVGDIGHEDRYLYLYQDRVDSVFLKEAKWEKNGEISLAWYYALDLDSLRLEFLPSYSDIEMVKQWESFQADTAKQEDRRRGRRERQEEDMVLPDLTWPSYLRYAYVPQSDPLAAKIYHDNYAISGLRLVLHYRSFSDTADLMTSSGAAAKPDTAAFRLSMNPMSLFFKDSLLLDFNFPVVGVDWEKASILEIHTDEEGLKDTVAVDMAATCLEKVLPNRYCLKYGWKPGCEYSFFVPSACFSDFFGRLMDTAKALVKIPALETYGQVALQLTGLDSGFQYLVQMTSVDGKQVLSSRTVLGNGWVEYPYVIPGQVGFVLIRDDNRNGAWDGGYYPAGIQPEKRWFFPKTLQVEADWRIEETWRLP